MRAENLNDDAKTTIAARIKHVRACAHPLDNLAHVGDAYDHGALPVPLVARPRGMLCAGKLITPRDITVTQCHAVHGKRHAWPVHHQGVSARPGASRRT
jgi:hypothetical protein